jgi:hypothetical protein
MVFFRKCAILFFAMAVIFGCRHKKHSLSGEEPVEVGDFIEFFPQRSLPYSFSDTIFQKKEKDSLLISYKIFTQFVPDSVLSKVFGKNIKPKIYPMGRIEIPKGETYLFVKTISGYKRAAFIISFDKKQKFIAAMPALLFDQYVSTTQSFVLDSRYVLTKTLLRKNADGSTSEGKDVYVLNADANNFMLIMTDPLDDRLTEIINPIDTLSHKNKLSADYIAGKMNLVSIRDSRKNDHIIFFIHFEKNNGECSGELKGEAILKSSSIAEYRANGDPCVLSLNFTSSSVTLKEEEGCGSHRGLRCLFDGNFQRKKGIKQTTSKKKSSVKK